MEDFKGYKTFFKKIGISMLITAIVGGTLWNILPQKLNKENKTNNFSQTSYQEVAVSTEDTISIPNVAQTSILGVVGISVLEIDNNVLFGSNSQTWGIGSGVIVSSNGYILTNHHVAGDQEQKMIVTLSNGNELEGSTVWSDPIIDLAIVKIDANDLVPLKLGDSNLIQVGETAIAIGNPLGLQFQRTVTSGIISALNRTIKISTEKGDNYMEDLIQTDASINPGNSGGPLLNAKGEVIGINTVKVESAEGIGFAIPINIAVPIINHLIEDGVFEEPYLGIFAYDKEIIPYMYDDFQLDEGIIVVEVDKNGPAFKSGLREGCIITEVDGRKLKTMLQLRSHIYGKKTGDEIIVKHITAGKADTVKLNLVKKDGVNLITR